MEKKTQQDYDKKWIEQNREHKRYLSARSSARSFIRNHAKMEDLQELKNIIKNKEMEIMEKVKEIIRSKYRVDGEDQKYIEVIESYNDLDPEETVIDKLERSLKKGQELEKLNFPIIFFDDSNSDSGKFFQADETEDAIRAASEYFEAK